MEPVAENDAPTQASVTLSFRIGPSPREVHGYGILYNAKDPKEIKDLNDIDPRDIICWKKFAVHDGVVNNTSFISAFGIATPYSRKRMKEPVHGNVNLTWIGKIGASGGSVASALASHQSDPDSIPGGPAPGFPHVGAVPDDATCLRVSSGYSRFPSPCIPAPLHHRVLFHVMFRDDGFAQYSVTTGNTARLARRSDEALCVRVSVARIAPSLLDLGRMFPTGSIPLLNSKVFYMICYLFPAVFHLAIVLTTLSIADWPANCILHCLTLAVADAPSAGHRSSSIARDSATRSFIQSNLKLADQRPSAVFIELAVTRGRFNATRAALKERENYICQRCLLISDRDFKPPVSAVRDELHHDLQSNSELEWCNSFLCRSWIEFRTTMVQPGISLWKSSSVV
ncbi:hypothetical protein PR048_031402 [Dryococelus australis]|uniref:Uncharacterized protein n=1 Tax=Dryococelus australis TaxID=614101 RepID=A0ABQ9G558_9NEOP|nr:hypothetical protein PR048_031402 [Dryococelus australis]